MHHMKTTSPPTQEKPKTIRLTIPVSAEVHEAFTRISKATGMPVGRSMAEWMDDTLDAAKYLAETLEKAREAPRMVAQQLHAYALGLSDETGQLLKDIRESSKTRSGRAQPGLASAGGVAPPSCNTGGKVPTPKGKGKGKP
jgi:hypothetical protein